MRVSIKIIVVSFIIFINMLYGQTNTLTYAAYMETIRDQIPELKINAVTETNAEMNLLSAKSSGDVNLSAQLGAVGKYGSLSSSSTTTTTSPTVEAAGIQAGIGVGSLIPYSGTKWSVNLTHTSFLGGTLYPDGVHGVDFNNYQPSLTIEVTQPLLRNFFGTLDRYPIKDAEYALAIAKLQRKLDDASVIVSYQKIYYQWIMYEKLLAYYRNMYITARRFENQMRDRYNNGLIDNDSYQNARTQTMVYSDYYAQNQVYLDSLLTTVSFFMPVTNLKPDHTTWDAYLDLGSNMQMESVPFADSVNGQIAYQSKIRAEYTLDAMKNGTLPNLDLVGSVSLNGLSPNSDGYFQSFGSMTNVEFFAGVQFSYPIGNRANKAQYKMAENSLYGIIAQYDQLEKDFNTQLQTYISRFNAYKNLIASKQMQIRAINSRIATQLQKLDQGRLEVDDLLTSRLELTATQTELLNLQYEFITTIFDYRALLAIDYE
ncbi:TolC family protein [uncultured Brachyspira sp.]|uniref:TolC family protein n=1 Tax=uncultured Brachyspira sp. TaxID=221953 RepID=UPI0026190A2A|nr:TolC family protein [uncultured Brachyspira sp.]